MFLFIIEERIVLDVHNTHLHITHFFFSIGASQSVYKYICTFGEDFIFYLIFKTHLIN